MIDDQTEQERRLAFQACALEEQPKLTNIKSVIAQEYFNHGWDAAMAYHEVIAKTPYFSAGIQRKYSHSCLL